MQQAAKAQLKAVPVRHSSPVTRGAGEDLLSGMTCDRAHFHLKAQTRSDIQQLFLAAGWKGELSSTSAPRDSRLALWHSDHPPLLTKSIATHRVLMWGSLTTPQPACTAWGFQRGQDEGCSGGCFRMPNLGPHSVGTRHFHTSASSQVTGREPQGSPMPHEEDAGPVLTRSQLTASEGRLRDMPTPVNQGTREVPGA